MSRSTANAIGDPAVGLKVSYCTALVAGAAVAAIHLRVVSQGDGFGTAWPIVWITFVWLALTASGPFLYVTRRLECWREDRGRPGIGERLWGVLGIPWLLAAFVRRTPTGEGPMASEPMFAAGLAFGLGVACLIALAAVWTTWVTVPPDRARSTFSGPWMNRLGLLLSISWPFQCALGLVVVG